MKGFYAFLMLSSLVEPTFANCPNDYVETDLFYFYTDIPPPTSCLFGMQETNDFIVIEDTCDSDWVESDAFMELNCKAGYYRRDSSCHPCVSSQYQDTPGQTGCKQCQISPSHGGTLQYTATSENPNTSANCLWKITCDPGKQWKNSECVDCELGTYTYSNTGLTITSVDPGNKSCTLLCPKPEDVHTLTWNKFGNKKVDLGNGNCNYDITSCYSRGSGCRPGQRDFVYVPEGTQDCSKANSESCKVDLYPMETIPKSIYVK